MNHDGRDASKGRFPTNTQAKVEVISGPGRTSDSSFGPTTTELILEQSQGVVEITTRVHSVVKSRLLYTLPPRQEVRLRPFGADMVSLFVMEAFTVRWQGEKPNPVPRTSIRIPSAFQHPFLQSEFTHQVSLHEEASAYSASTHITKLYS